MHKKFIMAAASLLAAAGFIPSCTREILVRDDSFDFSTSVRFDRKEQCHLLAVTLTRGDRLEKYRMGCRLDGSPLPLLTEGGDTLAGSFPVDFEETDTRIYRTGSIPTGDHRLEVGLSTAEFTRVSALPLPVREMPFRVMAEVLTPEEGPSRMKVTLLTGDDWAEYRATVSIDKEELDSVWTLSFRDGPSAEFALPPVRPGEHTAHLTVRSGSLSARSSATFREPFRFPIFTLTLERDTTGSFLLSSGRNPYRLEVQGSATLTMTGCTEFTPYLGEHTGSVPGQKTLCITRKGMTLFRSRREGVHFRMEADSLERVIRSLEEESAVYRPDGKGGYLAQGRETVHYRPTAAFLSSAISVERIDSVKVLLDSRLTMCSVNGALLMPGVHELPRPEQVKPKE